MKFALLLLGVALCTTWAFAAPCQQLSCDSIDVAAAFSQDNSIALAGHFVASNIGDPKLGASEGFPGFPSTSCTSFFNLIDARAALYNEGDLLDTLMEDLSVPIKASPDFERVKLTPSADTHVLPEAPPCFGTKLSDGVDRITLSYADAQGKTREAEYLVKSVISASPTAVIGVGDGEFKIGLNEPRVRASNSTSTNTPHSKSFDLLVSRGGLLNPDAWARFANTNLQNPHAFATGYAQVGISSFTVDGVTYTVSQRFALKPVLVTDELTRCEGNRLHTFFVAALAPTGGVAVLVNVQETSVAC